MPSTSTAQIHPSRIHGELQKLGLVVSQSTVAKYMRRHRARRHKRGERFSQNHASQIMAGDLVLSHARIGGAYAADR